MTVRYDRPRPPAPPRRHGLLRWAAAMGVAAILFALGVAVGSVLDDNPDPARSPTRTLVRTLGPLPLSAPPTVTVTAATP